VLQTVPAAELPFSHAHATIANSERAHACWSIENPNSKQLHKSLTLKMGPNSQQEFIVVLKVPQNKQSMHLAS